MTLTLGLIIICAATIISFIGYYVCKDDSDAAVTCLIALFVLLLIAAIRGGIISNDEQDMHKYKICVESGHEVVTVLNRKVCLL